MCRGLVRFPGGAVYLRTDMMKNRLWRSAASLAGPSATFAVLVVIALALRLWLAMGVEDATLTYVTPQGAERQSRSSP